MKSELALQKLNEVREVVDGETAEMVDTLAKVVMLQQDVRSPMLGAKVTLYLRPETKAYKMPASEAPEGIPEERHWQYPMSTDDKEYWDKWDFPWYNGEPEEEPEEVVKFEEKANEDSLDLVSHKAIVFEGNIAESAPEGELWDPNREEYKTADEYPMGTVNCIVAQTHGADGNEGLIDFEEDYPSDVATFTSIVPADGEPAAHTYTPGWD